jgi:hypothetical protein
MAQSLSNCSCLCSRLRLLLGSLTCIFAFSDEPALWTLEHFAYSALGPCYGQLAVVSDVDDGGLS